MDKPARKTTLKDVARMCNVSPMTVSKMLNGKGGVSKETAKRIWKAIRQLNYTPNLIAKSLRVNKTLTLGVVTSDSSELLFPKMISGIIETATASGYSVVIANSNQSEEREEQSIRVLLNKRIDGLVLAAPFRLDEDRVAEIKNFGIPLVLMMRSTDLPVDFVASDNDAGGYQLIEYLARTGGPNHGEYYFINLPREHHNGEERRKAMRTAMADFGIDYNPSHAWYVEPNFAAGHAAMRDLLASGVRKGTVVCGCDVIAVGAIQAALEAGVRIPEEIRITGYDDIEMLDYLNVPLTTMRQQVYVMGQEGVKILLRRIDEGEGAPMQSRIPCELILRKST